MNEDPILVTRATGFISSNLVRGLFGRGAKVIASNVSSPSRQLEEGAYAREEWGWKPHYSHAEMVDSFLEEQAA